MAWSRSASVLPAIAATSRSVLAAARTLHRAGHLVTVLEARDRVGGRTVSAPLGSDLTVDLGASWIHGITQNPIAALARDELGLTLLPTDYEDHDIFSGSEPLSAAADAALSRLLEALQAAIEREQARVEAADDSDTSLGAFFERWLATRPADERAAARYLLATEIEQEYAADAGDLSLLSFDEAPAYRGGDVMLQGGYGALPKAVAAELDVRLDEVVTHIGRTATGVEITSENGSFQADFVICAVPLGVLKAQAIRFEPPLPAGHLAALDRLNMGVLDKLFLRFERAFWAEATEALIIGRTDAPVGQWAEWINLQALFGKPVLLGFNAGAQARALEDEPGAEVVASALAALRVTFGSAVPEPEAFLRTRWGADPYARGSYSSLGVGAATADLERLAQPIDERLILAGEHTHARSPSTVHGAWLSGLRAAAYVIDQS